MAVAIAAAICACSLGACSRAPKADRLTSVDVEGSAFVARLDSGRTIKGDELKGAVLTLQLAGADAPSRVRIDDFHIDPTDPLFTLYAMSIADPQTGTWGPLCDPGPDGTRYGFPLAGQWSDEGARVSENGITLACAYGGALGKCVMWGYRPWEGNADLHAACVRMVRADYCNGGTTRNGMEIDVYDQAGINAPDDEKAASDGLSFEAAWTPEGAVCVAHTRVRENATLSDVAHACPALRDRLGPSACDEGLARAGAYGHALVFNRSKP